jgi:Tol biopolymer transport system component
MGDSVFLVPASGGIPTELTVATAGSTPSWSPDGSFIAFHTFDVGPPFNVDIYVTAGGPVTRLTTHPASDVEPAWFPSGGAIAFVSQRSGNNDIWSIQVSVPVKAVTWGGVKSRFRPAIGY